MSNCSPIGLRWSYTLTPLNPRGVVQWVARNDCARYARATCSSSNRSVPAARRTVRDLRVPRPQGVQGWGAAGRARARRVALDPRGRE
eukprot:6146948-Pleurochrysis_carterae.AAC.1